MRISASRRAVLAAGLALAASPLPKPAIAQGAPLRIGVITTLSGPGGYLGADARDALQLAAEMNGGRLGDVPVQFVVEDDALRPAQGKQIAERFLRNERIRLFTGVIFSNVLGAVVPDILDADGIYVSCNAGPSNFAGRECRRNYFVVSWQNDNLHESAGALANIMGYQRVFILAPNYQAGRDALTGFKRLFRGTITNEVYTRLDQTDYAAEMAQIRAARPDAVYHFHPGGLGIAFIRQYAQAGLLGTIPQVLPAPSMDVVTLAAVGDAAEGVDVSSHWNSDFDNAESRRFVDAFRRRYNRMPTYYAQQAYDTALAIGAALRGTGGSVSDPEAFRTAMLRADFPSTRGNFRFGPNQHPIQDWYALKVERVGGQLALVTKRKILENHSDAYAAQCRI
ncbi:ABC transporter substrate-binding protein [Elioraea thermophila]|uniref:ABC transporter substrate-binding protein n=1 Tax=Elioraea thermophila TaxID=2185104 RepID=UPI000DF4648F|nr:ABC transporter substrate-binding protein [Elioraea thermophila]